MPPGVWLVLPTFNEAENIEPMVAAVLAELESCAPGDHRVLIVDDSSPDGTGRLADRLAASTMRSRCCTERSARGSARHIWPGSATPSTAVPRMCSRWTPTSPTTHPTFTACSPRPTTAPTSRSAHATWPAAASSTGASRARSSAAAGCAYARTVLRLQIRDLTGGFKCFRREVLEAIHLDTVRSHGYCFQIELTQRAIQLGFTVVEVPIVFRERRHGRSKMSPWIAVEAFVVLPQLRWRRGFR